MGFKPFSLEMSLKCIKKTIRRTVFIPYSRYPPTVYTVTICFVGEVQSPIEYYLTGNMKESIRQTHLLLLWVLLGNNEYNCITSLIIVWLVVAAVTSFMTISRLELRTYMRRQTSRYLGTNLAPNPQADM